MALPKLVRLIIALGLVGSLTFVGAGAGAQPVEPVIDEPPVEDPPPEDPGPPPPAPPTPPPATPPGLPITLLPAPRGLQPGLPAPHGVFPPQCANDFCMPDLPIPEPFCQMPAIGDNLMEEPGGHNYGNIRKSCYQLVLALAFQPAPLYFVLQQFERNIHQECNEQFGYFSFAKLACYAAAPRAADRAAPLAAEVYGRIPVPGFNLPSLGNFSFPHPTPIAWTSARQSSHPTMVRCGWNGASPCYGIGDGQAVTSGTVLHLTGVVHPRSKMLWRFRDPSTNAVLGWFITDEASDNGVMPHERQAYNTGSLRLGPVRVEASYLRWEDNQTVTTTVATIQLVTAPPPPPGGGGGGGGGGGPGPCGPELPMAQALLSMPECDLTA